ncbi:MAG TPA: hypothetical protein VN670_02280 [Acidobacteriaceae bacterium]|nr:hypothetical protein [Acidobacteriaceae bacterium]
MKRIIHDSGDQTILLPVRLERRMHPNIPYSEIWELNYSVFHNSRRIRG